MSTKLTLLFIVVLLGFSGVGFTQTGKLQSGDSIRIEVERTTISGELIDLRDSIYYNNQ